MMYLQLYTLPSRVQPAEEDNQNISMITEKVMLVTYLEMNNVRQY
jgi:hypothetical protein